MTEMRIRFSKTGKAKYISHLDMVRCFSRGFFRTRIPLWFTEGFNPRPYMTFTSPLTLGAESVAEALDIRLENDSMTQDEILEKLNAVLPPDIRVLSVAPPVNKLGEIEESRYELTLEPSLFSAEDLAAMLEEVLGREELLVEKSGKKGKKKVMKTVNLAEHLKDVSVSVSEDRLVKIFVTLPSSSSFGVNPRLLLDKLLQETGEDPVRIRMVRTELYCKDGVLFE